MSLAGVVARGREAAERLMVDTCTITRVATSGALNEVTGVYGAGTTTSVYAGKCRVQARDAMANDAKSGERVVVVGRLLVSVPMSVTGVEVDDVVTITASDLDPDLVDRTFRVAELFHKSHATARRLTVEETQS